MPSLQDGSYDLIALCRAELYSAVICDTLDGFGLHNQVLPPNLRPLHPDSVLCGRVRTGVFMPLFHDDETVNVYEHEITLIDSLAPDDVPVLVCNGNLRISPWGELLTTRALRLAAAGCVTDGCVRDAKRIAQSAFPVFCAGTNPSDTKYRGKLMSLDVPAMIGGVAMERGDLIFGDFDGIVVVPQRLIDEVIGKALDKVRAENQVRDALISGESLQSVFKRLKVL